MKAQFKIAAQRQDPAVFDYEHEVAEAWRDFPQTKNKVFFFDASAGAKFIYPADEAEKVEVQQLFNPQYVQRDIDAAYRIYGRNSFCLPSNKGTRLICLYTEKHPHDLTDRAAPVAQEVTFIFDHELGHAIIPNGTYEGGKRNRAECIADAYAVIRHFQRYGADSPAIDAIVANRSFDLVFREWGYGRDHFTSAVTEKILAQRYEINWDSLTPQETADMARKFVLENEMDSEALRILDNDFGPLHNTAKDIGNGDATPIQTLTEKVLATDSSNVFKYGAKALQLCIDQQTAGGILQGEYWDKVRRKLAKRQKIFAQQSLTQTFNETAAAAYEAFPQELKKLVILLVPSSDTPVYVSPEVAGQLTKSTADIKDAVAELTNYMHDRSWVGLANSRYYLAGTPVNLIALDDKDIKGHFSRRYKKEMRVIFNLDHEIGHHIIKSGFASSTVSGQHAESACDAFAMLRHIQRFGKNTGHAGAYAESRASSIVLQADPEHYTTDAVKRAIEVANEMGDDISGLSLHATAALAGKIAAEAPLEAATLKKISDAFLPVNAACRKHIGSSWDISAKFYDGDKVAYTLFCRETIAVMQKYWKDPDVFKAGKQFLSYPPVRKFMREAAKTDPAWKEALRFIDNPGVKTCRKLSGCGPAC